MRNQMSGRPVFRKPPPEGVVEVPGIGREWSIAQLEDGSLLAARHRQCRLSRDGGESWSEERDLPEPVSAWGLLRLNSGALGAFSDDRLWLSGDEGRTWGGGREIPLLGSPYYDTLIQLSRGRLLYPNRVCFGNQNHPDLPLEYVRSYGLWKGLRRQVSGHYHWPEIDIASVSWSDDEGRTWRMCEGELMGWFDQHGAPNGCGGVTACDEPSLAETSDGRVLFLARSTVGRLVCSYSRDGGLTWSAVRPTELAASYSPPALTTVPETGDLICVWNQVSREEIRRGYRRGRLSAAVSRDSGATWQGFRTIEVSAGLEDVERVPAEHPVTPVIGLPDVGQLPDDFAVFRYPNVRVIGDHVFILYAREWFELAAGAGSGFEDERDGGVVLGHENVLRIYPLGYFYEESS